MDVAGALKALSQPHERGEKIEDIIARSARLAGLKYSRCYEIWYRRARRIEPEEVARIDEALKQKQAGETRNELQKLRLQLERIESRLVLSDPQYDRAPAGSLRGALRTAR